MRFVETPIFTKLIDELLDDDEYRALQAALLLRPKQGALIRGAGGLRKVRWGRAGTGRRGGLRVIHYWAPSDGVLYMLFVYSKSEQGDLTPAQLHALAKRVRKEFK